jgi:hypothetical protein
VIQLFACKKAQDLDNCLNKILPSFITSIVPDDGWSVHSKCWTFQKLLIKFISKNYKQRCLYLVC